MLRAMARVQTRARRLSQPLGRSKTISSAIASLRPSARPEWPGHAAFILTGLSFASPSELSLRLLAASSCTLACLFNYYHPVGKVLWLPLRWNALYLTLNVFYVGQLLSERFVTLGEEEERMYHSAFSQSMAASDFKRLAALGERRTLGAGEEVEVITKGQANDKLVLLLEGTGMIILDESENVQLRRTSGLFGEVSFLHGQPASASVRLQPGSRYVTWCRGETQTVLPENARRGLEHAISLEVTRHLSATTSRMVALTHPKEETRIETWKSMQIQRLRRDGTPAATGTAKLPES